MLYISQKAWSLDDLEDFNDQIETMVSHHKRFDFANLNSGLIILIPEGDGEVDSKSKIRLEIGNIAKKNKVFIAGSYKEKESGSSIYIRGFVFDDLGDDRLSSTKMTPDLIDGLSDSHQYLSKESNFKSVATPIGKVGLLLGSDILYPHLARSLVWAGSEIILNPGKETSDDLFQSRQNATLARAFENACYVASSSALNRLVDGKKISCPNASGLSDWAGKRVMTKGAEDFIRLDVYVDKLRRRRSAIFGVAPLHLRAKLFADGYKKIIAALPPNISKSPQIHAELKSKEAVGNVGKGTETEYDVILVQSVKKMIQKTSDVRAMITENVTRALELPGRTASNPNVRLVALSEFFMTGQGGHGYRSPITLQRLAIHYPGPEMELLSEFALKHKVFLAGSSFEKDDKLPGYIFNSAFILNDSGDLIHRYRKIQCADVWGSLPDTTPGSIYDKYLDTYGYDFLFPVADTPLGKLATMVCFDQAHPEIARMLVKNGAEVLIHPSSEGHGSGRRGWDLARQTRAFENVAYLLSPLPGGEHFNPESKFEHTNQMRGFTKIVNFDGTIQGEIDTPGAATLSGTIDLLALRRARANPHINLPLWDNPSDYIKNYQANVGLENNLASDDPMENPYRGMRPLRKVLSSYYERGIFTPPTETSSRSLSVPGKAQPDFDKPEKSRKTVKTLADEEKMDGEYIQV